jgi:hypothetical protein
MAGRDIIVVGASAGGIAALAQMARGLPAGFPASVFVVCHFPQGGRSALPEILSRSGPLPAAHERAKGNHETAARFDERATQADKYGRLIVEHVLNGGPQTAPAQDGTP